MEHHSLDPYPIPKEKSPLYINEPWLIDTSRGEFMPGDRGPEAQDDNVRVYIPLDLNREAILRRLNIIIEHYGEANERNEFDFQTDVETLISQIEIYDQIWYGRHMSKEGDHSKEAIALVEDFVERLEEILDGCAEMFPFETIDTLREEYLTE